MCGSCGQKYYPSYAAPLTVPVRGIGSTKGVIKSPARLEADKKKAEAAAQKAVASAPSDPLIPVAGTSGPANKLENPDEK